MTLLLHKAQEVTALANRLGQANFKGEHSAWCYTSLLLPGLNPAGKLDTKFSLVMLVLFCVVVSDIKRSLKGTGKDHRKNSAVQSFVLQDT